MSYERMTDGIRVRINPRFSLADSDPGEREFVFSYHVELENRGVQDAQLLFRHLTIHDAAGEEMVVDGEGVIGVQPRIAAGRSHDYTSFCVLRSPLGYMEGYYTFERPDGTRFRVELPRADLRGPIPPPSNGFGLSGDEAFIH